MSIGLRKSFLSVSCVVFALNTLLELISSRSILGYSILICHIRRLHLYVTRCIRLWPLWKDYGNRMHTAMTRCAKYRPLLSQRYISKVHSHLLMDQRIPGPVSCRLLEHGWFVGDPTPLARDNVYVIITLLYVCNKYSAFRVGQSPLTIKIYTLLHVFRAA